jgi:hypothetical protein
MPYQKKTHIGITLKPLKQELKKKKKKKKTMIGKTFFQPISKAQTHLRIAQKPPNKS